MFIPRSNEFARLERTWGIHFAPDARMFIPDGAEGEAWRHDIALAFDAQPALITTANNGIPAWMTNLVDPEVVRVLFTPNDAADIYGETQKGDWTKRTITFNMIEATGETAAYGDWDNNGSVGVNINFPQRQSFHYQVVSQYGDREIDTVGEAKINYVSELDVAAAMTLDKYQNQTYFFGVAGLHNYGALNDPALPASITPNTKAAGGTAWDNATSDEIYGDFVKLYEDLANRCNGLINRKTPMTFALSPGREALMTKTNQFAVNVSDLITKNFPNAKVKTAAQYSTQAGQVMQLKVDKLDGRDTTYCSFTEKLRSHGFVRDLSATKQKKSQGTWGCVIRYPIGISNMLGI